MSVNKSLIKHNNVYKKWIESAPPTIERSSVTAIPKMTSNTSPSGRAFASSIYSDTYDAYKAFNQIDETEGYATASNVTSGYLGYEFSSPIVIGQYAVRSIHSSANLNKMPKDWTFEASNDGVNWIVLDTQKNQLWSTSYTDKSYNIQNVTSYLRYRLNWSTNGAGSGYTDVNELKMFEVIRITPSIPPAWQTISATLPSKDTFVNDGMSDLSILDRKATTLNQAMSNNGALGIGKIFKTTIDLNKYFEIQKLIVK
jgi:hypothetical protein